MTLALAEAEAALLRREVPIAAVFVKPGGTTSNDIIALGSNLTNAACNPTAHAEMVALTGVIAKATGAAAATATGPSSAPPLHARDHPSATSSQPPSRAGTASLDLAAQQAWHSLRGCEVYVTVEPCVMCAGALARVAPSLVVFGASNPIFGGCGTVLPVPDPSLFPPSPQHHPYPVLSGVHAEQAIELLQRFYTRANTRAPVPKHRGAARSDDGRSAASPDTEQSST